MASRTIPILRARSGSSTPEPPSTSHLRFSRFGGAGSPLTQGEEPGGAHHQRGAGACSDLQAPAAIAGYVCARIDPANADPEEKSERVPEHIHMRISRAQ